MSDFTFRFESDGYADDAFVVLSFTGRETISENYAFELELVSVDMSLDTTALLQNNCTLAVYRDDICLRRFHGILDAFEETQVLTDKIVYKATLVSRLSQLGYTRTNEIYLDETIRDTIETILTEAGFASDTDYRFELQRNYRKWSFRLQYGETHLDFLQRITEREGIYYFFVQEEDREVVIFCDTNQSLPQAGIAPVVYQPIGGVNVGTESTISQFIGRHSRLPHKVVLRDFNEERPSEDIRGEAIISDDTKRSCGEINIYGLNIETTAEGEALAEIHAAGYRCRQSEYAGVSDVVSLAVGHTFKIDQHPKPTIAAARFIVDSIDHTGQNLNYDLNEIPTEAQQAAYSNQFVALDLVYDFGVIPSAKKPEMQGTLNAVIDAESDGEYAELDEHGRYRVKFPFDRRGRAGGKSSYWVRMMQPYAGKGEGMHFPLRKDTRVLLSFIGGDPDRPVIAGAISDSGDQSSVVNAENQTNKIIQSAAGNRIEIEDKQGSNRIKLESPTHNTYLHIGAPNHSGSGIVSVTSGIQISEIGGGQLLNIAVNSVFNNKLAYAIGYIVKVEGVFYECVKAVEAKKVSPFNDKPSSSNASWKIQGTTAEAYSSTNTYSAGAVVIHDDKPYICVKAIAANEAAPGATNSPWKVYEGNLYNPLAFYPNPLAAKTTGTGVTNSVLDAEDEVSGNYIIHRASGPQYSWKAGVQYNYFADDYLTATSETSANKRFFFGTSWEVHSTGHLPNAANAALISTMEGYALEDATNQILWTDWTTHLNKGRVRVAAHNTFTSQNGSIFDFGGYSNYNLGKRYVENTTKQEKTKINRSDLTKDWLDKGGPTWTSFTVTDDDPFENTEDRGEFEFSTNEDTRVEKNIDSASYSYSQSSPRIDVTYHCDTTAVRYGGIERVVRFNDHDKKVYEYMEEDGISDEWIFFEGGDKKSHVHEVESTTGGVTETTLFSQNNPVSYERVAEPAPGTEFSFKSIGLPSIEMSLTTSVGASKVETIVGAADNEVKTDLRLVKNKIEIKGLALENELEIIINPEHIHNKGKLTWEGGFEDESNLPGIDAKIDLALAGLKSKVAVLEGASLDLDDISLMVNSKVGVIMDEIEGIKIESAAIAQGVSEVNLRTDGLSMNVADLWCAL